MVDSSKKQNGVIQCDGYMPKLNNIGIVSGKIEYGYNRNVFDVFGSLYLSGGSVIAGRSKEYWVTTGVNLETGSRYTGNGKAQVAGTAIKVEKDGNFFCYGGTVEGRGYEDIFVELERNKKDTQYKRGLFTATSCNCAVRVLEGGNAVIYDGNFIGNAGAIALFSDYKQDKYNKAEYTGNISIYSGFFKTTVQPVYVVGHAEKPLENGSGYTQHLYFAADAGNLYDPPEWFMRGGSQAEFTYSENFASSANDRWYSVKPAGSREGSMTFNGDIRISDSRADWEKDADCDVSFTLKNSQEYFPEDSEFKQYAQVKDHSHITQWQLQIRINNNGKYQWKSYPWRDFNSDTVAMKDIMANSQVGDVCVINVRKIENWDSANQYAITASASSVCITVVAPGSLCDHDFYVMSDTATCASEGVITKKCKKCQIEITETSPKKTAHNYVQKHDDTYCWEECTVCRKIKPDSKKKHVCNSAVIKKTCEEIVTINICKYCGYAYTKKSKGPGHDYGRQPWFYDADYHWVYCKECKEIFKEKHNFGNGDTCSQGLCGYEKNQFGDSAPYYYQDAANHISLPVTVCGHGTTVKLTTHYTAAFQSYITPLINNGTYEYQWASTLEPDVVIGRGLSFSWKTIQNDQIHPESNLLCRLCKADGSNVLMTATAYVSNQTTKVERVEPTCTKDGIEECYICGSCGHYIRYREDETIFTAYEIEKPVLKATGEHTYNGACDPYCNDCGTERVAPHAWKEKYSYDKTSHYYECGLCGDTKDKETHTFTVITEKEATCSAKGVIKTVCSVCGYVKSRESIDPLPHQYQLISETKATCTSEGHAEYKCSFCEEKMEVTIPVMPHSLVFYAGIPATCMETGTAAYYKCADCEALFTDEDEPKETSSDKLTLPIDPNNHVVKGNYEYSFDKDKHWAVCTCGAALDSGEHVFGEEDGDACTVCGYIPNEDLVRTEEEESALSEASDVSDLGDISSVSDFTDDDDASDNGGWLAQFWWIILIAVVILIIIIILVVKLSKKKKSQDE